MSCYLFVIISLLLTKFEYMEKLNRLLAGLGGALALNLLHEGVKHYGKNVPRVDLVGEEALEKGLNYLGTEISDEKTLYNATLAGDLIGNTIYYSLIGAGNPSYVWPRAIISGLSAGIGAVKLAGPMGLDERPVAQNSKVKILTVSYYLAGALITALILSSSRKQ